MALILPIQQWRNGEALVDPSGSPYDPNLPPALISGDAVLGPAVLFGRENASRIGVTVLCGMQIEAADLGQPGEFEAHLRKADIFGNGSFGLAVEDGTEGYRARIETAFIAEAFAKPRSFQPFNIMDWRGMEQSETRSILERMEAAIDVASDTLAMMRDLDMASLDMGDNVAETALDIIAGRTHLTNHLNWLVVASACDQAKILDQHPGSEDTDRIQILIDESPLGVDVVRKFGALGIDAALHQNRREAWPAEVAEQVLDFGSIMATGRIDAAY
jgi:hypothetical protein